MPQDNHIRKKTDFAENEDDIMNDTSRGIGEKLESGEIEEAAPRVITFREKKDVKPELKLIGDKGAYTSTYIRLVNGILANRLERIKKLKEMDKNFDDCIRLLQSGPLEDTVELDRLSANLVEEKDIKEVLQCLLIQKGIAETELEYLTTSVNKKTEELRVQETEMRKKTEEIQKCSKQFDELNKKLSSQKSTEADDDAKEPEVFRTIKEELASLGQKHDVQKLSKAIEELVSSFDKKNR